MRPSFTLTTVLCLLSASTGSAQAVRTEFGVEAGLNLASLGGSDVDGADTRTGFAGGGFMRFPLGPSFAVEPAVFYSQQGATDNASGVDITFKLDYVQIPVRLRYATPLASSASIRPYAYAGPALGISLGCKIRGEASGQSAELDCDDPAFGGTFDAKSVDFGLHLGAGVDVNRFTVGLRYQLGLSSIDDSGNDLDVKNRVFAIVAGYRFGGPR